MRKRNRKAFAAICMSGAMLMSSVPAAALAQEVTLNISGQEAAEEKDELQLAAPEQAVPETAETAAEEAQQVGDLPAPPAILEQGEASPEPAPQAASEAEDVESAAAEDVQNAENGELQLENADAAQDAEAAAPEAENAGEVQLETTTAETAQEEPEKKVTYERLNPTGSVQEGITAVDVTSIVENAMPAIVSITETSVQQVEDFFYGSQEFEVEGAGSGIIISQNDTELLIVTNNHVVADAKDLTVCFTADAEKEDHLLAPAVIKGTSSLYDLAVIAVQLSDINEDVYKQLKIATLGSSKNLKVGESAIVIGNALGTGQTVTAGIISALEREITTEAGTFTEFQTDAAINLGCSGGAILNAKGEVIGITSAKATSDYAESMGYGIPIDTAIPILQNLINRETRSEVEKHGYLGITVVPVSEEARQMYNMPAGAFVYEVGEGSAAEKAGIEKGNIIVSFDGAEVASSDELVKLLGHYEVGETCKVELMVANNGTYETKEVEVTLQEGEPSEEETEEKKEEDGKDKSENENVPKLDQVNPDNGLDNEDKMDGEGFGFDGPSGKDDGYGDFFYGFGSDNNGNNNYDGWGDFFFGDGFDGLFGGNGRF